MKPTKPKPIRAWAIKSPRGKLIQYTVANDRRNSWVCIGALTAMDITESKDRGWKAVRVTITEDAK